MARLTFNKKTKALKARLVELEARTADLDLKGDSLLELIKSNGGGGTVTQKASLGVSGVLAAVSLRSRLLASFPKGIFLNTPDGRTEIFDDPLYKILAYQPNPYMNAFTFWELINTWLDLDGNAYAFITRYAKQVTSLTHIASDCVEIITERGKLIYRVKEKKDRGLNGDHSPSKFLHFKDISLDGITGLSRVNLANKSISLSQSSEDFAKDFFDKGGQMKGVIESNQVMGDPEYSTFKKRWAQNVNHGVPLLEGGKQYKAIPIPMGDSQLNLSRQFQMQDIARIFDVPPHLLAELSRSTFSNIEHADLQFVKYGLRPMVKRYEAELEVKLLGDFLGKKSIRFNLDGILRGDTAARAAWVASMKQNEIMTANELRVDLGKNKSTDPKADLLENPNTTSNTESNTDGQTD